MKTTTSQHGERCLWRRSWSVGIATALLAAAPFVASAQNDDTTGGENSTSSYEGVAGLTGQTFDQLKAGITTDYSYKDPSKVYFLYNVGTGKFLNVGGYWGYTCLFERLPNAALDTRRNVYDNWRKRNALPQLRTHRRYQ